MLWSYKQNNDSTFQLIPPSRNSFHFNKKNGLKYWISQLAIYRYFKFNSKLKLFRKKKKSKVYEGNIIANKSPEQIKEIRTLTHFIINKFKNDFPNQRIIFLMDAPRKNIYAGNLEKSRISWMNELMANACKLNDFEFIDLSPHFTNNFKEYQKRFEFAEDNHWNAHGHQVVANVLYEYLQQKSQNEYR